MIEMITSPLRKAGISYDIFKDVVPDPPIEKISDGVRKLLDYRPEAIVAVGGGSAIDSSKSIREFAKRVDDYGEIALIAIPTTSGTGSEVTSFAVISDRQAERKYPLVSYSELIWMEKIMTVRSLVNWVQFMLKEMDIPLSLSQMGTITEEEYMSKINTMADAALLDGCTATNPRKAAREDVIRIYKALW